MKPDTGRMHQIRVHLASIGHPCLGDPLYGGKAAGGGFFHRQALHALALSLRIRDPTSDSSSSRRCPTDFVEFLATKLFASDARELRRWIELS